MNVKEGSMRALDTMFYQWALSEEDQSIPTIMEDVQSMDDAEKVNSLLEVFSHLTFDVMEAQLTVNSLEEQYVELAEQDEEMLNMASMDSIVEQIQTMPDVLEAQQELDDAIHRINLFQKSFAKSITQQEV